LSQYDEGSGIFRGDGCDSRFDSWIAVRGEVCRAGEHSPMPSFFRQAGARAASRQLRFNDGGGRIGSLTAG